MRPIALLALAAFSCGCSLLATDAARGADAERARPVRRFTLEYRGTPRNPVVIFAMPSAVRHEGTAADGPLRRPFARSFYEADADVDDVTFTAQTLYPVAGRHICRDGFERFSASCNHVPLEIAQVIEGDGPCTFVVTLTRACDSPVSYADDQD